MGNPKKRIYLLFINAAAFLTAILIFTSVVFSGEVNYIYDDIGRLIKAIDDQGNEAIYTYDAVGNLLSISGNSTTDSVAIIDISPWEGSEGTIVTIYGKGFSSVPAENIVLFNGISAVVASSTLSAITTSVPAGAGTGRVTVQTPLGSAMSAKDFNVVQPIDITISPSFAFLAAGSSQQFTTAVTGTSNTSVTWSVEGIEGGAAGIGTISADGLYTAPSTTNKLNVVTVTARSVADSSITSDTNVYFNVNDRVMSNNVSIGFPKISTANISSLVSNAISIGFGIKEPVEINSLVSSMVSIGIQNSRSINYEPLLSQPVSIEVAR